MLSPDIKPYCNKCNMCRPSTDFNKTSNGTYKYTCKVCEIDSERNQRTIILRNKTKNRRTTEVTTTTIRRQEY